MALLDGGSDLYLSLRLNKNYHFGDQNNYFSKTCNPEPVISYTDDANVILVGSDLRGLNESTSRCFSQVFIVCANAALMLHQSGLDLEDCVVPGICFAGDGFQFVTVYLVPEGWPVMVVLTDILDVKGEESRCRAAEWLVRIASFAGKTADLYRQAQSKKVSLIRRNIVKLDTYFLKPIGKGIRIPTSMPYQDDPHTAGVKRRFEESSSTSQPSEERHKRRKNDLNQSFSDSISEINSTSSNAQEIPYSNGDKLIRKMFQIYKALAEHRPEGINEELILFPTGVANLPPVTESTKDVREAWFASLSSYFPEKMAGKEDCCFSLIIYPMLENWKSTHHKPLSDADYIRQYIQQLEDVVKWLNAARVSHNDLLPRNILWSIDENQKKLSLRLIDFEDATFFGEPIPADISYDKRYPFYRGNLSPSEEANNFFLDNIKEFINQREVFSFREFMEKKEVN